MRRPAHMSGYEHGQMWNLFQTQNFSCLSAHCHPNAYEFEGFWWCWGGKKALRGICLGTNITDKQKGHSGPHHLGINYIFIFTTIFELFFFLYVMLSMDFFQSGPYHSVPYALFQMLPHIYIFMSSQTASYCWTVLCECLGWYHLWPNKILKTPEQLPCPSATCSTSTSSGSRGVEDLL